MGKINERIMNKIIDKNKLTPEQEAEAIKAGVLRDIEGVPNRTATMMLSFMVPGDSKRKAAEYVSDIKDYTITLLGEIDKNLKNRIKDFNEKHKNQGISFETLGASFKAAEGLINETKTQTDEIFSAKDEDIIAKYVDRGIINEITAKHPFASSLNKEMQDFLATVRDQIILPEGLNRFKTTPDHKNATISEVFQPFVKKKMGELFTDNYHENQINVEPNFDKLKDPKIIKQFVEAVNNNISVYQSIQHLRSKGLKVSGDVQNKVTKSYGKLATKLGTEYLSQNSGKLSEEFAKEVYKGCTFFARITKNFNISSKNLEKINNKIIEKHIKLNKETIKDSSLAPSIPKEGPPGSIAPTTSKVHNDKEMAALSKKSLEGSREEKKPVIFNKFKLIPLSEVPKELTREPSLYPSIPREGPPVSAFITPSKIQPKSNDKKIEISSQTASEIKREGKKLANNSKPAGSQTESSVTKREGRNTKSNSSVIGGP